MRLLGVGILAAAVWLGGCTSENKTDNLAAAVDEANAAVAESEGIVAFELTDMSGSLRNSSEWDGQPKLLNFWATWCAPCRREIPLLKKAQDEYSDLGLQVIGIAVDFREDVVAYAEEAEFNYPILVGQEDAMSVAESSGVPFIGLPFTMVVSPSGELIKTHVGEIHEEDIAEIARVLGEMENGSVDLSGARDKLKSL